MRIALFAPLLLLLSCASEPSPLPPYNIVWITVEDMSPHLAAYGDSVAYTPHIDRLAREGVRYTHVFSISGVCAPSRAALITGMYPTTIGAQHMRTMRRTSALADITDPELLAIPTYEAVPPPEVKAFTEYLRANNYYTTNRAKEDYQFRRPITAWDASSNEAHWRNRPAGQPFFSVFNIATTHESRVWGHADHPWLIDTTRVTVPPYYPDTPIIRRDVARHYNNIQEMDAQVGEVLAQLEEDGLMDRTIIFFFSDHGDGLPRAKRWLYDSGLHVPLLIRWPDGRDAGTIDEELISFIDFAPTMLSLLDIPIPEHMQGQAFLGAQQGEPRTYIFAARDRMDPVQDNARAVRDKRFKYIRNYQPEKPFVQFLPYRDRMGLMQELLRLDAEGELVGAPALWFRKTKPVEELYDTQNDPHEIVNLADDPAYQDKLEELRAAHLRWKAETHDWGLMPETELVKRLWPPDGLQPQTEPVTFTASREGSDGTTVHLTCATEGASIAYRLGEEGRWLLYTDPLPIPTATTLYAQAIRIGFKHSEITEMEI